VISRAPAQTQPCPALQRYEHSTSRMHTASAYGCSPHWIVTEACFIFITFPNNQMKSSALRRRRPIKTAGSHADQNKAPLGQWLPPTISTFPPHSRGLFKEPVLPSQGGALLHPQSPFQLPMGRHAMAKTTVQATISSAIFLLFFRPPRASDVPNAYFYF